MKIDFPKKENPDYEYLYRIINTVKDALKISEKPKISTGVSSFMSEMSQMANSN